MAPDGRYPAAVPPRQPATAHGYPPNRGIENGFGTGALILGVMSVVPCFWTSGFGVVGGFITSFFAIALGITGRQKAAAGRATNGNFALGGLVLGCVGLVIAFITTATLLISLVAGG